VPTAYTEVMTVQATGKRTFFYRPGAHDLCSPDHFDFTLTDAAILHLGLPGTLATMDGAWRGEASGWVATLKGARAAGLRTNLELCPVADSVNRDLTRPCLPYLDYLIINDAEAGAVAGIATVKGAVTDVAACEEAARTLRDQSAAELIVVHFPGGCIAVTRAGTVVRQPSVNVPPAAIKGSNGAGDAFAAGMLLGIHEAWPLEACLKLASATAAASLRSVTTNGAVESWQACLRLAEEWGWREALP
jgi:sugar/nucleoside kinase (ribokinase family)